MRSVGAVTLGASEEWGLIVLQQLRWRVHNLWCKGRWLPFIVPWDPLALKGGRRRRVTAAQVHVLRGHVLQTMAIMTHSFKRPESQAVPWVATVPRLRVFYTHMQLSLTGSCGTRPVSQLVFR